MISIKIIDLIGTPNAILQKFGLQLLDKIDPYISQGEKVKISFNGIENLTTGFLNASFGKLYKKYGVGLDKSILLEDLHDIDWKEKYEDAKLLALNPEKAKIIDDAIADLFN